MSLIEEALRRVKDPLIANTERGTAKKASPAPADASQPQAASVPSEPSAHSWSTASASPRTASQPLPSIPSSSTASPTFSVAVGAVLLCTVLFLVGGVRWIAGRFGGPAASAPTRNAASRPSGAIAPAAKASRSPADAPDGLMLTGTVEGLGQPYAMINEQIVRIDESIGEWTVTAVGEGTVTLRDRRGKEIALQVAR